MTARVLGLVTQTDGAASQGLTSVSPDTGSKICYGGLVMLRGGTTWQKLKDMIDRASQRWITFITGDDKTSLLVVFKCIAFS